MTSFSEGIKHLAVWTFRRIRSSVALLGYLSLRGFLRPASKSLPSSWVLGVNGSRIDRDNSLTRLVSVMFYTRNSKLWGSYKFVSKCATFFLPSAWTQFSDVCLQGTHESCIRRKEIREVLESSRHNDRARAHRVTLFPWFKFSFELLTKEYHGALLPLTCSITQMKQKLSIGCHYLR